MRDNLQPPDPGCYSYAEVSRRDEIVGAYVARLAATDIDIAADRFVVYLADLHSAAELAPLLSAVSRGDRMAQARIVNRFALAYAAYLRQDDDIVTAALADAGEPHGHA